LPHSPETPRIRVVSVRYLSRAGCAKRIALIAGLEPERSRPPVSASYLHWPYRLPFLFSAWRSRRYFSRNGLSLLIEESSPTDRLQEVKAWPPGSQPVGPSQRPCAVAARFLFAARGHLPGPSRVGQGVRTSGRAQYRQHGSAGRTRRAGDNRSRAGNRQCDLCRHWRPAAASANPPAMCCTRSRKTNNWRFPIFPRVPPSPVLGSDSTRLCLTRWRSPCPSSFSAAIPPMSSSTRSLERALRC
jgi:hypothetical protein